MIETLRNLAIVWLLLLVGSVMAEPNGPTPPRLSLIEGEVTFWRPGAEAWSEARPNTPLAEGDVLYADGGARFELQIGGRAFVRAAAESELALLSRDPDFLQFEVGDGLVSFDLRVLPAGVAIEIDTPHAALTVDRPGYYRFEVDAETTRVVVRRGGRATLVPGGGSPLALESAEQTLVARGEGNGGMGLATFGAGDPDDWDDWNYDRSDRVAEAQSERYLPPDVYGAAELDSGGHWRVVAGYGRVWVPADRTPGWAPYTDGHWIWDPYYGWTWIDDAPWGWAPFHYGRWVYVDDFWAWAPGPVVRQSVYAPALVAFFSSHGDVSLGVAVGTVSWVALAWGEPLVPWWGRRDFVGVPWWGGWGGPRVVNNVVVDRRTTINVTHIHFRNARLPHAIAHVPHDRFGRGRVHPKPAAGGLHKDWRPVIGRLPVEPTPASLTSGERSRVQPRRDVGERRLVTIREPRAERRRHDAARFDDPGRRRGERPAVVAPSPQAPAAPTWVRPQNGDRRDRSPESARRGPDEERSDRLEQGRREHRLPRAPAPAQDPGGAANQAPTSTVPTGEAPQVVVPVPRPAGPVPRPQRPVPRPPAATAVGSDEEHGTRTALPDRRREHRSTAGSADDEREHAPQRRHARPRPEDESARDRPRQRPQEVAPPPEREQRPPRDIRPTPERNGWAPLRRDPPRGAAPDTTREAHPHAGPQRPFETAPRTPTEGDDKAQKKRRRDDEDASGRGLRQRDGEERSRSGRDGERR